MRKLILIVNDDGIKAPGIRALAESVIELGDVVVVAPDSAQSGKSNALTIDKYLEINTHNFDVEGVELQVLDSIDFNSLSIRVIRYFQSVRQKTRPSC